MLPTNFGGPGYTYILFGPRANRWATFFLVLKWVHFTLFYRIRGISVRSEVFPSLFPINTNINYIPRTLALFLNVCGKTGFTHTITGSFCPVLDEFLEIWYVSSYVVVAGIPFWTFYLGLVCLGIAHDNT